MYQHRALSLPTKSPVHTSSVTTVPALQDNSKSIEYAGNCAAGLADETKIAAYREDIRHNYS